MKINYIEKSYKIADKFKDIIEKKLEKLDRYFENDVAIKVNCSQQGKMEKLEITINADNFFFRSEVISENMYANIDEALPKLEKQIVKNNGKYKSKYKKGGIKREDLQFIDEVEDSTPISKVVRKKSFEVYPISVKDAQANMEALGHTFYIFVNDETGKLNVLYKRNDNDLGLIEVLY